MIGLFDSGLGGLSVVRRVRERLPQIDLTFFADQAHVPYGDRTPEDLLRLLGENLAWFDEQAIATLVMACNTSCAIAAVYGWPPTRAEVLDLIDAAALAIERAGVARIGVVATAATVRTRAYTQRIQARVARAEVIEIAAPALVPLVEADRTEGDDPRRAVAEVCAQLPGDLDAVVLGCTHYPALDEHFAAALGPGVLRIDPAFVQAERVAPLAAARNGQGRTRYVTNGNLEAFRAAVIRLTGEREPFVRSLIQSVRRD